MDSSLTTPVMKQINGNNRQRLGDKPTTQHILQETTGLELVATFCKALEEQGIVYCHWKSNAALDRSLNGDNDLDLLIDKADEQPLNQILHSLGFRQTFPPHEKQMPGVLDYHGFDLAAEKVVHVHAHYQLVIGHDATKNYRLPIEKPFLAGRRKQGLFQVPEPEFEYAVFVIRMVLKHATWDTMLARDGKLTFSECREFDYLEARIKSARVNEIVNQYMPCVGVDLFADCVQSLKPGCPLLYKVKNGRRLQRKLRTYARRPSLQDTVLKLWRRFYWPVRRRLTGHKPKFRMASGGTMIAIVCGDGAGKSTAVNALSAWLGKEFETYCVHMGKPPWSLTTIITRSMLKAGYLLSPLKKKLASAGSRNENDPVKKPDYRQLIWHVCTARDRYLNHIRAQQFANNGGIVISDRFPLSQIKLMDGPQIARLLNHGSLTKFQEFLIDREQKYYRFISPPDLVVVLRVEPRIAVRRKIEEDADSVFERSTEIWEMDWCGSGAAVVDAEQNATQVLTELKSLIWKTL